MERKGRQARASAAFLFARRSGTRRVLYPAGDDEERCSLPALGCSAHHDHESVPMRAKVQRGCGVVGEGMNAADELILVHFVAEVDEGLPDAILRARSIVLQVARIHQKWCVGACRVDANDLPSEHAVMAENILDARDGVQDSASIDGLAEAELAANRNLAFCFGLIGEQAGGHLLE